MLSLFSGRLSNIETSSFLINMNELVAPKDKTNRMPNDVIIKPAIIDERCVSATTTLFIWPNIGKVNKHVITQKIAKKITCLVKLAFLPLRGTVNNLC
jgi:hypothetical protein